MGLEEDLIETGPLKDRLLSIRERLPGQTEMVYSFASYLSQRLGDEPIYKDSMPMVASLVLADVSSGVDGYTGKKIVVPGLTGFPRPAYTTLGLLVPKILDAVLNEKSSE